MNLAGLIAAPELRVIAIVGCSKNCGKTSTLNYILEQFSSRHEIYGILSIGIDGEEYDFWLGLPKPRIWVRPGFLVATTENLLRSGTATARILAHLDAHTPLGELILARVEQDGFLMLAGVRHKTDVQKVLGEMLRRKVSRVIIDGSYHRLMAADPEVSNGAILVTGAVLGKSVKEVAIRTKAVLERLRVPQSQSENELALMRQALRQGGPVAMDSSGNVAVLGPSGLCPQEEEVRRALGSGDVFVAVPGAVSDRFLRALLTHRQGKVVLIVPDSTRLFVSSAVYNQFLDKGGRIVAYKEINLLAIAVNPVSILGGAMDAKALVEAVEEIAAGIPVFLVEDRSGRG